MGTMTEIRSADPWTMFASEPAKLPAVQPHDDAPVAAPVARIALSGTDEPRALALGFGSAAVDYALDERGISRHVCRPGRADEVMLIPWSEVTSYRVSESTEHAALRVVGRDGQTITLRQAHAPESTYQFIRDFAAFAERRSPLQAPGGMSVAGIAGAGVLMVITWILLSLLSPGAEEVGTVLVLALVAVIHSYGVLTDDDRALEDRQSDAWDAKIRDRARTLLRIEAT